MKQQLDMVLYFYIDIRKPGAKAILHFLASGNTPFSFPVLRRMTCPTRSAWENKKSRTVKRSSNNACRCCYREE